MKIRTRFFISIFSVVLFLGVAASTLGFFLIQTDIVARSQREMNQNLSGFRNFFQNEISQIGIILTVAAAEETISLEKLKAQSGLDYLAVAAAPAYHESAFVRKAAGGEKNGGTRVIRGLELEKMDPALAVRARIPVISTAQARPSGKTLVEDALVIEYAVPLPGRSGMVLYGGTLINNNTEFIDRIHGLVFADDIYDGKPVGTTTIFLDDVRITTNVLTEDNRRAIGTRVSERVYRAVAEEGNAWRDRAFVVTDWYLTAYEAILGAGGERIGMIYVGTLEQPFHDMTTRALLFFLAILAGTALLGALLTLILVQSIARPIAGLVRATQAVAAGHYQKAITWVPKVNELAQLTASFNDMTNELHSREKSLHEKSETLSALNKSYLDLIGFVSHELKGILASTILNAYTVRDGFLGMINFKQRKALDSITRNLDYLAETVKNFLNLSRIEKGELTLRCAPVRLKHDVITHALENFEKVLMDSGIEVTVAVPDECGLNGDRDLLQIVANNLIGNAIKYGRAGGRIVIEAGNKEGRFVISFYNDGDPLSAEDAAKLFGKFVRLDHAKKRHIKGTGLGLFITKEIIESHGGDICCEPRAEGNAFVITFPGREYAETA